MAVSKLDVIEQYLDNNGDLLAGGLVYTYTGVIGGSSTPRATYADNDGTLNPNPVVLDDAGRCQIWFTQGVSYNVVIKTAAGVTLETIEAIAIPSDSGDTTGSLYVDTVFTYGGGPPGAVGWLGGERFARGVTFPANFTGAYGFTHTNPASSFVIDVQKNGSTCGTITVNTSGVYTFASAGGAVVNFATGDRIDAYGPTPADAAIADFGFTLAGTLT